MNAKQAVRSIMSEKGIGTRQMADLIGANMQKVCDRLGEGKSANMSIEKLDEFLTVLGYKILVVPESVKCKEGWYEVDSTPTPPSRNETI